jgi:hypothetical protein
MAAAVERALRGISTGSLVVDTNILLLLVVGGVDPARLGVHKRTRSLAVSPDELGMLVGVVERFRRIRTTPTILAEASNLLGERTEYRALLAELLLGWIEVYEPSLDIARRLGPEYLRLGLVDAAMIDLAAQGDVVLTDDAVLYHTLLSHDCNALNFTHLRDL